MTEQSSTPEYPGTTKSGVPGGDGAPGLGSEAGYAVGVTRGGGGGGDGASKVSDGANTAAESARHGVQEVADDAKRQTRHLLSEARDQVRSEAEGQTGRASHFTRELSEELREIADRGEASGYLTSLAGSGADTLDRFSSRLDQGGLDGALDDVRSFARRRPGLFLAGCFGAGVVLGRVLHNADRDHLRDQVSGGGNESGSTDQQRGEFESGTAVGSSTPVPPVPTGSSALPTSAASSVAPRVERPR
jgi:hypothetical protein